MATFRAAIYEGAFTLLAAISRFLVDLRVRLRVGVSLLYMGKGRALKHTVRKDTMTYEVGIRRRLHVREHLLRVAERDLRVSLPLSTRFKDSRDTVVTTGVHGLSRTRKRKTSFAIRHLPQSCWGLN